jgi:hypothetical protein
MSKYKVEIHFGRNIEDVIIHDKCNYARVSDQCYYVEYKDEDGVVTAMFYPLHQIHKIKKQQYADGS